MIQLDKAITRDELQELANNTFEDMIKGVVDIRKKALVVDAELHSDIESYLLNNGSKQDDLWGINLYPSIHGTDFIEFDSLINIRPGRGNRSRGVESPQIQQQITDIVNTKIIE